MPEKWIIISLFFGTVWWVGWTPIHQFISPFLIVLMKHSFQLLYIYIYEDSSTTLSLSLVKHSTFLCTVLPKPFHSFVTPVLRLIIIIMKTGDEIVSPLYLLWFVVKCVCTFVNFVQHLSFEILFYTVMYMWNSWVVAELWFMK